MQALISDFITISLAYRNDFHRRRNYIRSLASILVFAGLCSFCSAAPMPQAQNLYTDPSGAFTVVVPVNWQIQRGAENHVVSITNETYFASIGMGVIAGNAATTPTADRELEMVQTQFPAPANLGTEIYHDPRGRYSLTVPDGWIAEPQASSGALQLSSGPSWAMLVTGGGSEPREVNHQITQQIQAQFTGFQLLNEGDLQINGHASHGSTATGVNPKGKRVSILVLSINAGSGHFLSIISSAPNDQAHSVNATIMQIAQSIRFAGE